MPWKLYSKNDDNFVLSVLCGGIGMYEFKTTLTPEELSAYESLGTGALDKLAYEIMKNSERFSYRQYNP